jgi:hypothetical protein
MTRKYQAVWGESYNSPGTKTVDLEFFRRTDLGYDQEDLALVEALEVGEAVKLDSGDHSVTRVE